jgi:hypothetical protein
MTPYVASAEDFVVLGLTYGASEGAVPEQPVEIVRHPDAPRYASADLKTLEDSWREAVEIASDVVERVRDVRTLNAYEIDLVRQTALVNLYFFLRYVCAYANAYSKLKPTLHGEMCNARQRAILPGTRYQCTVPRSTFKSTVNTTGAGAWSLVRNPNRRIGIFSGIQERAVDFMHMIQRIFDANDFVTLLWPATRPTSRRDGTWNEKIAIMPCRTISFVEPSVRAHAAGGSTAGIHVDDALIDDIVSDKELTSSRDVTSEMIKRRDWLQTAIATILDSPLDSTVSLSDTRYAIDDPYESPTMSSREHLGDWTPLGDRYPVDPDGEWTTYYRSALVDGVSIFPEKYTCATLERLAKRDFWTYITQFVNNPYAHDKIEFGNLEVGHATFGLGRDERPAVTIEGIEYPLEVADVVLACDPASSESRRSMRTSRSAIGVIARFPKRRFVVLAAQAGYYGPTQFYDALFGLHARFAQFIRTSAIEAASNFKFLVNSLREEEVRRQTFINVEGVQPLGDKLATIRSTLEPILQNGTLFIVDACRDVVLSELRVFPSASLDVLDMLKIGISRTVPPANDDEESEFASSERTFDNAFVRPATSWV